MDTNVRQVRTGSALTTAPNQRVRLVNVGHVTVWWGADSAVDATSGVPLRAGADETIDTDAILYASVGYLGTPPAPGLVAVSSVGL